MDKFRELEISLEEIIKNIDESITIKHAEYTQSNQDKLNVLIAKEETTNKLNELKKELNFLKFYDHQNIILKSLKEFWNTLWQEFKNQDFYTKMLSKLFFLTLVALSFMDPTFWLTVTSIIAVLNISFAGLMVYTVKKHRKLYTIEKLEQEVKSTQKELELAKTKEEELNKIKSQLAEEIKTLEIKLNQCRTDIQEVQSKRNHALEKLVSEKNLNSEFNEQQFSAILTRIKIKEKKEGEK